MAVVAHLDQHRVAAGDEQDDQRHLQRLVLQERRVEVGLHVVHPDEGNIPRERQRLGRRHTDQQRTHQPGSDRTRNGIDTLRLDTGLDDGPSHHRVEQVEVRPTGDLGHHAAVLGVQVDLGRHDAGEDVVATHHQRGSRLVATRLDAEHDRGIGDVHRCTSGTESGLSSDRRCRNGGSAMSWHHMTIASSVFS